MSWGRGPDGLLFLVVIALAGGACGKSAECRDCFEEGYRIDLSSVSAGTAPPAAVLFSGWSNGWCRDDLVCTGTPDVHLGDVSGNLLNVLLSCDAEDQELVTFAGGHAPTIARVNPSLPELPVTLNPARPVGITLWIVGNVIPAGELDGQAQQAKGVVFTDLGTGIDLTYAIKPFPSAQFSAVPGLYNDARCDLDDDLYNLRNTALGGYDDLSLNVYYVEKISYIHGIAAGINCSSPGFPDSHPEVMFVVGSLFYSPMVLAHELGHALGLGHVDEVTHDPYLAADNLMRSAGTEVGQITLGQIYRMHFDKLSWIWNGALPATGYPRECQSHPAEGGACPPLTLHPPRGWP